MELDFSVVLALPALTEVVVVTAALDVFVEFDTEVPAFDELVVAFDELVVAFEANDVVAFDEEATDVFGEEATVVVALDTFDAYEH